MNWGYGIREYGIFGREREREYKLSTCKRDITIFYNTLCEFSREKEISGLVSVNK